MTASMATLNHAPFCNYVFFFLVFNFSFFFSSASLFFPLLPLLSPSHSRLCLSRFSLPCTTCSTPRNRSSRWACLTRTSPPTTRPSTRSCTRRDTPPPSSTRRSSSRAPCRGSWPAASYSSRRRVSTVKTVGERGDRAEAKKQGLEDLGQYQVMAVNVVYNTSVARSQPEAFQQQQKG